MSGPNPIQRATAVAQAVAKRRPSGVSARLRNRAAEWIAPVNDFRLPVSRGDLLRAAEIAADGWEPPLPLPLGADGRLEIAWVCVPQSGGTGGFTNLFRLASALERSGHRCIIYLHDRHGWSIDQHRQTMRSWWPAMKAEIRDAAEGIEDAHAIFASSWETAYPVLGVSGARCPLLSGPGLRAALLRGRQQCTACRGDLPVRIPRRDGRAMAGAKTPSGLRDGGRPFRLRL